MAGVKGRSGRPRLPSAVKKARGTYAKSRAAQNEVTFPVTKLEPPDWLSKRALEEWHRVVPLLYSVKVLTEPDLIALANYCSVVGVAIKAQEEVNRLGLFAAKIHGSKMRRVNPLIKVAQEARTQALRYAIEFGLTPAARSRVMGQPAKSPSEEASDKEEAFLFHPPRLVVNNKKG